MRKFKAFFYRIAITLTGKLPLPLLRFLGSLIGSMGWLMRSRAWLVTRENIDLCYPELDSHRRFVLSKESLRETGKTMLETTYAWSQPSKIVRSKIHSVSGEALVQEAKQDHGVVFIIPHQGNWEIINHYLGHHYGLTHMFQPNQNPHLSDYIQSRRVASGTQFVPTGKAGIRAQLKILRERGSIGVMPDQEPLVHTGRFAPFYGTPALTNDLLRGYARSDTKLFTAVCTRDDKGFSIHFDPIIIDPSSEALDQLNQSIESAIRRKPSQYLWSYKRFRTRPDGELDYYQFDRHPLRTWLETVMLAVYTQTFRRLPSALLRPLATSLNLIPILAKKRRKVTRINLVRTQQAVSLAHASMIKTFERALEAPKIWQCSDSVFDKMVESAEVPFDPHGTIVLIPPLGSRECTIRYLTTKGRVMEYYHSNSITSLDRLIRHFRTACGVQLVEHDDIGRTTLRRSLDEGRIVTLCPDQQPRLRGGTFVPFFGIPALTTNALPDLLRQTNAKLMLGYSIREKNRYLITLKSIEYNKDESNEHMIRCIHAVLEQEITQFADEYRWSDKRYNIQPVGQKKVYR